MRRHRFKAFLLLAALLSGGAALADDEEALRRAVAVLATLDHAAMHCPELVMDELLADRALAAAALGRDALRETDAYISETLALNRSQETYDYQTHCQTLLDRHAAELPGLLKSPES